MAVRIRMTRTGKKNRAYFRIAVFDSQTRRDGPYLEKLGAYDPEKKDPSQKLTIDSERYQHWVNHGALPTEALKKILKHTSAIASQKTNEKESAKNNPH